jgi:hypothetical protein
MDVDEAQQVASLSPLYPSDDKEGSDSVYGEEGSDSEYVDSDESEGLQSIGGTKSGEERSAGSEAQQDASLPPLYPSDDEEGSDSDYGEEGSDSEYVDSDESEGLQSIGGTKSGEERSAGSSRAQDRAVRSPFQSISFSTGEKESAARPTRFATRRDAEKWFTDESPLACLQQARNGEHASPRIEHVDSGFFVLMCLKYICFCLLLLMS